MSNIIDRQTFVISVNLNGLSPSLIQVPINLRFAADELILKALSYKSVAANADTDNMVQIWCSITNDGLIGSFPNNTAVFQTCDSHFIISNTFQTGNVTFQFQKTNAYTAPFYYNPQSLISDGTAPANVTRGILSFTIEFVKHSK